MGVFFSVANQKASIAITGASNKVFLIEEIESININKLKESYGRSGIPLYVYYPYEEYGPVLLPEILNRSILESYLEYNY